jgi:hypothetical protein
LAGGVKVAVGSGVSVGTTTVAEAVGSDKGVFRTVVSATTAAENWFVSSPKGEDSVVKEIVKNAIKTTLRAMEMYKIDRCLVVMLVLHAGSQSCAQLSGWAGNIESFFDQV